MTPFAAGLLKSPSYSWCGRRERVTLDLLPRGTCLSLHSILVFLHVFTLGNILTPCSLLALVPWSYAVSLSEALQRCLSVPSSSLTLFCHTVPPFR